MVTTDAIVEGVHFLSGDPPGTLARKALRVNLSDIAAKGAAPAGFVLTLALRKVEEAWLKPFATALGEDAADYGCPLLGGDTVSTPGPLMISITAFGRVPHGKMVHRAGARAGDLVFVTGTIGDAALGLDVLRGPAALALADDAAARDFLATRYRVPQPRNALALAVRDHASAAMDVSDGLAGDLSKLCAASGVSADIELSACPVPRPLQPGCCRAVRSCRCARSRAATTTRSSARWARIMPLDFAQAAAGCGALAVAVDRADCCRHMPVPVSSTGRAGNWC